VYGQKTLATRHSRPAAPRQARPSVRGKKARDRPLPLVGNSWGWANPTGSRKIRPGSGKKKRLLTAPRNRCDKVRQPQEVTTPGRTQRRFYRVRKNQAAGQARHRGGGPGLMSKRQKKQEGFGARLGNGKETGGGTGGKRHRETGV